MKNRTCLFVIYTMFIVTLFLPWFTYDSRMMGYCWGIQFLPYFLMPTVLIALYLFRNTTNALTVILAEIGAVSNLIILLIIFATWQGSRNIITGFHWRDGFHTAQPGFWLSFVLACAFIGMLQFKIIQEKRMKETAIWSTGLT